MEVESTIFSKANHLTGALLMVCSHEDVDDPKAELGETVSICLADDTMTGLDQSPPTDPSDGLTTAHQKGIHP